MIFVWKLPYKGNKYRKKNTPKTQAQIHTTSEIPKINKNTKNIKKKNTSKGGNPNDVHKSGKELIEKKFSG